MVNNNATYRLAYNFVRRYGVTSLSSIRRICERYGLLKEKKKLDDVVEDIRNKVKDSIGKTK